MGKPTGFLDYERKTSKEIAPKARIKNFNEFHIPLSFEEQKKQVQGVWTAACRFASMEK